MTGGVMLMICMAGMVVHRRVIGSAVLVRGRFHRRLELAVHAAATDHARLRVALERHGGEQEGNKPCAEMGKHHSLY